MRNSLKRALVLLLPALTLTGAVQAAESVWPARPITLIVPFPPGGTTDLLARLVGRELTTRLKQTVVIENRAGAGGGIGAAVVARAQPDGYTLLMGTVGTQASNQFLYREMPYHSGRDFAAITLVANSPNVLMVGPGVTVNSVAELIEAAQAHPGQFNYASTSVGGSPHLSGELFGKMAKIEIRHVPYKGSAPAMTDLLGGQVQLMFDNLPSAIGQIKAGKVRALAMTTTVRAPMLPDVPTVAESGLPGYEVNSWFGLLAPANTPAPIVNRIQAAVADALAEPALRKQVEALGAIPVASTPEDFTDIIAADTTKWQRVIRDANIVM